MSWRGRDIVVLEPKKCVRFAIIDWLVAQCQGYPGLLYSLISLHESRARGIRSIDENALVSINRPQRYCSLTHTQELQIPSGNQPLLENPLFVDDIPSYKPLLIVDLPACHSRWFWTPPWIDLGYGLVWESLIPYIIHWFFKPYIIAHTLFSPLNLPYFGA